MRRNTKPLTWPERKDLLIREIRQFNDQSNGWVKITLSDYCTQLTVDMKAPVGLKKFKSEIAHIRSLFKSLQGDR